LDIKKVDTYKKAKGRFKDYKAPGVKIISNLGLLSLDVDVLVLAGIENTVTVQNMKEIKANYIVELANGPTTSQAYEYLTKKSKVILPDIIANAGGVIVSYLEWYQNQQGIHLEEDEVNKQLALYIKNAVGKIYSYAAENQLNLKEAAFAVALEHLIAK
jgi:glutamate dehydrogenase/leucine dehydrogenase